MTAAAILTRAMTGAAPRVAIPCAIRAGKPDDLPYVVDSWIKHAHRRERPRTATKHVRALLSREGSALFIAHVPDDADAILGWVVIEKGAPSCVHYVYVRSTARLGGVASALLSGVTSRAVEYSTEAPAGVVVPKAWVLNTGRART